MILETGKRWNRLKVYTVKPPLSIDEVSHVLVQFHLHREWGRRDSVPTTDNQRGIKWQYDYFVDTSDLVPDNIVLSNDAAGLSLDDSVTDVN